MKRLIQLAFLISSLAYGQSATTFLDPTRALPNWTSAGFTIPSYTVNCVTQPSLATGSGNAAANTTSIQNALASCDSSHNVVLVPSGTYYFNGIKPGTQGKQVIRGAGANLTDLIFISSSPGCTGGLTTGICMIDSVGDYNGSAAVQPGGSRACNWTAGYVQGTTSITLNSCGGTPPVGQTIILDQANDTSDTGGVYICDVNITNCGYESDTGGNNNGRSISGVTHSEQQVDLITAVSGSGSGPYTVTLATPIYFTNIRSGQSPGAWWPGYVANIGVENTTLDGSALSGGATVGMYNCSQCWVKGVRVLNSGRNSVDFYQTYQDVVRDSYFFGSQGSAAESYSVEADAASAFLVENNIFQQVTTPYITGAASGGAVTYNVNEYVNYTCNGGCPSYGNGAYPSHNAGNAFNLFEGNNFFGIWGDDAWGSSDQNTYFRNMLTGWQSGKTASTFPFLMRSFIRVNNVIGGVYGQPSYTTQYQAYATSTSAISGGAAENTSIYSLGIAGTGPSCTSGFVSQCDPLTFSTLMRWGNWDVANNAVQWNATEASPGAVTYVSANFTSSYFTSLAHTLPASLIYSSAPSWWGSVAWPPIGTGTSTGNVGICSGGTYAGSQTTSSGKCTGGSLATAWGSLVNAIPAQLCYLNTMGGPPDGSGSALTFNASTCYSATPSTTPGTPALIISSP